MDTNSITDHCEISEDISESEPTFLINILKTNITEVWSNKVIQIEFSILFMALFNIHSNKHKNIKYTTVKLVL